MESQVRKCIGILGNRKSPTTALTAAIKATWIFCLWNVYSVFLAHSSVNLSP